MKKFIHTTIAVLSLSVPLACGDEDPGDIESKDAGADDSEGADSEGGDSDEMNGSGAGGGEMTNASGGADGAGAAEGSGGLVGSGGDVGSGGSVMATGGMGGGSTVSPVDLSVVLDDLEGYAPGANPMTFGWTKGDIVEISTAQANSGSNSIIFLDDDAMDSPEIQAEYTAASRGVIRASVYMVPDLLVPLEAYITVYGEGASSAFRLADYRFASDGDVHWRTTASGSWGNTTLTFPTEQWVDVEVSWDMNSGTAGESWVTVGGQTVGPLDMYAKATSTVLGIKFGSTEDVSNSAAIYIDDVGYTVE